MQALYQIRAAAQCFFYAHGVFSAPYGVEQGDSGLDKEYAVDIMASMKKLGIWVAMMALCVLWCGCASDVINDEAQEEVLYYGVRGHLVAPDAFFPDAESMQRMNDAAEQLGKPQPFGEVEEVELGGSGMGYVRIGGVWNEDYEQFRKEYDLQVRVFWVGRNRGKVAKAGDEVAPVYVEMVVADRPNDCSVAQYREIAPAFDTFIDELNREYRGRMKDGAVLRQVGAAATARGRILPGERSAGGVGALLR